MMERNVSNRSSKSNFFNRNRLRMPSRQTSHSHPSPKPPLEYIRGELIGKGSYGRVYLGLNARTGEVMAIKQVELIPSAINRTMSQKQKEIIEAFKREIDMLRGLDHEHIVKYLGYEENPESLNIFLEYVPGGTIKTFLTRYGRFREDVTKSLTTQILSGLVYLHTRGIIHRDLKPDNILLEQSGICKISDFGISKQVEDMQDVRAYTGMRGTVQWMAPEIVDAKKGGYDEKVDIWSVGCVVLEMWSGEQPWSGEAVISVIFKLSQHKQPPPVPSRLLLGPVAEQFRLRCFEANPQNRPTAAELKAHPYLTLPPNWKFPYVMHERKPNRRSRGKSAATVRRISFSVDPDAPPVPTLRPSIEKSIVRETPEQKQPPSLGMETHQAAGIQSDDASTVRPSHVNDGPPLVRITPPGSPMRRSYTYDELELSAKSSDTSESAGSSRHRRRRLMIIANPDGDSDSDDHKKFVFTPPPLPEFDIPKQSTSQSPPPLQQSYSSERYPSQTLTKAPSVNGPNPLLPNSPPLSSRSTSSSSTGNSRLSLTAGRSCANPDISKSETDYSDDSEAEDDLFLWSRPPADLYKGSNGRKLVSASSPSLSQGFKPPSQSEARSPNTCTMLTPRRSKRTKARETVRPHDSWLVRPDVQEVLSDLQGFFPNHGVGQAIAEPDVNASNNAGSCTIPPAAQGTSPVGRQAEAQPLSPGPFRRMTRIWRRSHVGEPKT